MPRLFYFIVLDGWLSFCPHLCYLRYRLADCYRVHCCLLAWRYWVVPDWLLAVLGFDVALMSGALSGVIAAVLLF